MTTEGEISKTFNEHLINFASRLKPSHCPNNSNKFNTPDQLLEKSKFCPNILKIRKKLHSSIFKIKVNFESLNKFAFKSVIADHVRKEILHLDDYKATQCGDILAKILNEY